MIRSKEFLARLQGISNDLVEEKKKHKEICILSSKCPHEMACINDCYFTNTSFVQNETEDTDDEYDTEDDESNNVDNGFNLQNDINKCRKCNFEAKSLSGLKTHEKTGHKINCELCDFRTITKLLLNKNLKPCITFRMLL